ncbi:MAG: signal recognition particle subunit SRP19/SEC65 family protein [Candidatus Bathyarchaeota archaeon]
MRKQNNIFLWSVYFDSTKTRSEGRKVSKKLSVPSPKLEELQVVAKKLGFQPKTVFDAAHPSTSYRKSGLLVISKTESKGKILKKIAKELSILR